MASTTAAATASPIRPSFLIPTFDSLASCRAELGGARRVQLHRRDARLHSGATSRRPVIGRITLSTAANSCGA
jgi:hypothetical protein